MGMKRWFGKGSHEEEVLVTQEPPETFLVMIEADAVDEDNQGVMIDMPLTVSKESLNHITHVFAINGVSFRVEPLS